MRACFVAPTGFSHWLLLWSTLISLQGGGAEHAVRIAGNAGSEEWRFWVDLATGGRLHIEVAVTYWQRSTAALDKLIAERMPPWTTLLSGVSMHSDWSF